MQVFNVFMKILKSKIAIALIYVGVFMAVAVVLAFSNDPAAMFEQTSLNICVFDEDNTSESHALIDFLSKKNNIVELENDHDIILDALYYERANYVLTIKEGYSEKLAAGDTDDLFGNMKLHDSYSTVYMGQFLNEYVGTVSAYIAGGNDLAAAVTKADAALSREAEVTTVSFSGTGSTGFPLLISFYFRFLPYIILGSVMNTLCPVLLVIGRKDIRYRMNCSGLRQSSYTSAIFAGSALFIAAEWLLFMIVGIILNGGMYTGNMWIAVLNSFVFTLFSAMLTTFVSGFEPSNNVVTIATIVISIGMSFLCGIFVEIDLLGDGVVAAARFLPAYWYIRVNRMISGTEVYDSGFVAAAIGLEAAFAAVFAVLTVLVRRVRYTSGSRALNV